SSYAQDGGSAMSRGDWSAAAATIMGESSCVNVAAQSSIDLSTRELSVNVEAYYTANSTVTTNKLNVAILQNNIEGPQTGGSSLNPGQILANGNYNHMHMLRHLLTGQYGESIDTTTLGTFISRTYTYTIPADLNSIAYDLFNIDVVVFMAEGNEEILSGSQSSMTYIVPPGMSLVDLEAKGNMADPNDYCATSVTPSIKVTNNSSVAVSSFDVSYSINNGTAVSNTISTSLASGASTTYDFSSITPSSGANNISYSVSVSGSYYDSISTNNSILGNSFNVISNSTIGTTHSEDFESYSLADDVFNNAIEINEDDERLYVVNKTVASPALSFSIGGHGNSENSLRFDLIAWSSGSEASVIFEKVNFSSATNPTIDFTYATTGFMYSGTEYNDGRFVVNVSKDCGITWTNLFDKTGSALQTTAVTTGSAERLYPQSGDWATISLDASSLAGESEVIVQFKGSNSNGSWGNALYLDDINIGLENTGINDLMNTNRIELYPNPTSGIVNIATKDLKGSYSISLFDLLGKKIKNYINLSKDVNSLDLRDLNKGVYMIELTQGESVWTEKLILE
ncbi:MAG TPA: Omp28-related outer membrane protein, partial [Bacteroidetes bacterium]|nr:Omp28-related outer membrane protein [Bacteroidota bacterium]